MAVAVRPNDIVLVLGINQLHLPVSAEGNMTPRWTKSFSVFRCSDDVVDSAVLNVR